MDLEEKVLRTDVVFQGRYLRTEVQTVLLPDGKQATREIVSPPDAVGILAIDQSSKVYLVRQYRPPLRRRRSRFRRELSMGMRIPCKPQIENVGRRSE